MATYTFNPVPAWGAVGEFARVGIQRSATFPCLLPAGGNATVVQGGVTKVGYVESDADGLIPGFTTTDIPTVLVDFGIGTLSINSIEAITAGAASAAAAASSATAAASSASTASSSASTAVSARDAAIGASIGVTLLATGTAGTDTTNLNSAISAAASGGYKLHLRGAFNVNDTITVPAGANVEAGPATITQTVSSKVTVNITGTASWTGGTIVGKSTDYVAGGSPVAMGISTTTTTGVRITNVTLTGHSGAAIRGLTVTDMKITGCRIVGVGSPTITSGDASSCYGILIDTNSSGVIIANNDISETCQGIITGLTASHLTLTGNRIHDIRGQHGVYIQNGTGLVVSGLEMYNVPLNGLKVQISGSSTADSVGTSITGVVADTCGDVAVTLNNVATDLTSAFRFRGLTIANVVSTNGGRGLYLGSVRGATVSNVNVYNCSLDAITLLDCQNIEGRGWVVDTCGRIGVRFTSATGSSQDRIRLSGLRIHNAANNNVASNIYGIYMLQGSNVTLDGPIVTASNGFMQYGLFLSSSVAGDQNTFAMRDAEFSGDTGTSARFQGTVTGVKDWANNRFSGTILNKPNSVTAVIAVP